MTESLNESTGLSGGGVMNFSSPLFFLGKRNYVHASTLYDAILAGLSKTGVSQAVGPVRLDIHALITRQMNFFFSMEKCAPPDGRKAAVYFNITTQHATIRGYALENDEPIADVRPYDESLIESASVFKDQTVRLSENINMPPIQIALSLNKQLHSALGLSNPGITMLAARLEMLRPFIDDNALEMSVTLKNRIGAKLTHTTIRSADTVLGSLYTSQGK